MKRTCWLAVFCLAATAGFAQEQYPPLKEKFEPQKTLNNLPLVFQEDFESGADRWEPTDKTAWTVKDQGGNKVYALIKKRSNFNPPTRSPYNRSLVKDVEVGSFVFDVKLQSTHPDYGHRDLCLFFGYQDDAHLYYVHFGKKADPHANQIFIVNNADRKKISTKTTEGTDWDDNWHHARIVRDVDTGKIEVFFDDMENPVMTAEDKTFATGRVGVGSFDDTGQFDQVALYGNKTKKQANRGQVSGTVTLNGQPLSGATIKFISKNGQASSGVTDQEGKFSLKAGTVLGEHKVSISTAKKKGAEEKISPKYNAATVLTVDVKKGENVIDFALSD